MPEIHMNVDLMDKERLVIQEDVVYRLKVHITGPVILNTADNQYIESIICDVFVHKSECRSDSDEDLLRCATRRIEQLTTEAHQRLVAGTL